METRGDVGLTYRSTRQLFCSQTGNQVRVSQPCSPAGLVVIRLNYHVNGSLIFTKRYRGRTRKSQSNASRCSCCPTVSKVSGMTEVATSAFVRRSVRYAASAQFALTSQRMAVTQFILYMWQVELGESQEIQPKLIITLEFLLLISSKSLLWAIIWVLYVQNVF